MNNDLISREELKKKMAIYFDTSPYFDHMIDVIDSAPAVKEVTVAEKTLDNQWIPITFRGADDEEYALYEKEYGDIPREECNVYNCQLPDDGQEVLITTSWGSVCEDIFHAEPDGYFFEDHYDPDEVIAWMPKPGAYKKGGDRE